MLAATGWLVEPAGRTDRHRDSLRQRRGWAGMGKQRTDFTFVCLKTMSNEALGSRREKYVSPGESDWAAWTCLKGSQLMMTPTRSVCGKTRTQAQAQRATVANSTLWTGPQGSPAQATAARTRRSGRRCDEMLGGSQRLRNRRL
jgi:hypothetical protein